MHGQRHKNQYPEAIKTALENVKFNNYLDSVESPERALKRLKELVHPGELKLTNFESNDQDFDDEFDGSPQSAEPKVIASSKEESLLALGLKWDHNNYTLALIRGLLVRQLSQRQLLVRSLVLIVLV